MPLSDGALSIKVVESCLKFSHVTFGIIYAVLGASLQEGCGDFGMGVN